MKMLVSPRLARFCATGLMLLVLGWLAPAARAAAPVAVSITPTDGATDVPVSTVLVIVFDQDMAQPALFATIPGVLVGNFEIEPANLANQMYGTLGADKRTLSIQKATPYPLNITVKWKLNPAGTLFAIKSAAGEAAPTLSGTFTTGIGGPVLGSSTPSNDQTGVATNSAITFRFNQAMKTNTAIGGAIAWSGTGLDPAKFRYTWSADSRALLCAYQGGLPVNVWIDWRLNPADAAVKFESAAGKLLPSDTYAGRFRTAAAPCFPNQPTLLGTYGLFKNASYVQDSAADPAPREGVVSFSFSANVTQPSLPPMVTNGSFTFPDGRVGILTNAVVFTYLDYAATAEELDGRVPAGAYTMRFTRAGLAENVVTMTMPATRPNVPKILNFDALQSMDPKADFTLQWTPFAGATATDTIFLNIYDERGTVYFQAPDFCFPRELAATASSIVIPAGTLDTNRNYLATINFGRPFYSSTNDVPQMSGYGAIFVVTSFDFKTAGGSIGPGPAVAARFTSQKKLANGSLEFTLAGTASRAYGILRAPRLFPPSWVEIGTATMDASGQATYLEPLNGASAPLFYRAVSK